MHTEIPHGLDLALKASDLRTLIVQGGLRRRPIKFFGTCTGFGYHSDWGGAPQCFSKLRRIARVGGQALHQAKRRQRMGLPAGYRFCKICLHNMNTEISRSWANPSQGSLRITPGQLSPLQHENVHACNTAYIFAGLRLCCDA